MKKVFIVLFAVLAAVLVLSTCTHRPEAAPAAIPEETAAPTPEPTPEPTPDPYEITTSVTLPAGAGAAEIGELYRYAALESVDATACTEYELLAKFALDRPDTVVEYSVPFGDAAVSSLETELDLAGAGLQSAAELEEILPFLPRLTHIRLIDSGLDDLTCRALADKFPERDFVWLLHFGYWNVPTDLLCFSTLVASSDQYRYTDEDFAPLFKYCRHLRALDIGHNDIRDLTLIGELRELQVLIIADNPNITDITPLANLTELEYLEIFTAWFVEDFSPLAQLHKMKAIDLAFCKKMDNMDFISEMPELQMCWAPYTAMTQETMDGYVEQYPDVNFRFVCYEFPSATPGEWRETEMNTAIRTAFRNWPHVIGFESWDSVEYDPNAEITYLTPSYERN